MTTVTDTTASQARTDRPARAKRIASDSFSAALKAPNGATEQHTLRPHAEHLSALIWFPDGCARLDDSRRSHLVVATDGSAATRCSFVALGAVPVVAISGEEVERIVDGHGGAELAVHAGDGQLVDDVGIVVDAVGTDAVGGGACVVA